MTDNIEEQLMKLLEREREIIKKMNSALRANSNLTIMNHFNFLLEEVRLKQQELRLKKLTNNKDSNFDDYLSIG